MVAGLETSNQQGAIHLQEMLWKTAFVCDSLVEANSRFSHESNYAKPAAIPSANTRPLPMGRGRIMYPREAIRLARPSHFCFEVRNTLRWRVALADEDRRSQMERRPQQDQFPNN